MKLAQSASTDKEWAAFVKRYRSEMAAPEKQRLLLLAAMSRASHFSVGCYCARNEARCHRSVLRELLRECGAELLMT